MSVETRPLRVDPRYADKRSQAAYLEWLAAGAPPDSRPVLEHGTRIEPSVTHGYARRLAFDHGAEPLPPAQRADVALPGTRFGPQDL